MENFVSVNPPVLSQWAKRQKEEQANKAFKALGGVALSIAFIGFCVGMLAGWFIWG